MQQTLSPLAGRWRPARGRAWILACLPLAFAAALWGGPAAAAGPSFLGIVPPGDTPGEPFTARYSQAVLFTVMLVDLDGPLVGAQVVLEVQAEGADTPITLLPSPTDGQGRAVARLTLVDGRHGGASFPAAERTDDVLGHRYSVRASYAGTLDADDPLCVGADAGVADAGAAEGSCPSEAEAELFVSLENVALALEPGNVAVLGEQMTLIATLYDENGDAPVGGTAIDGDEQKPIGGASISFFFDLDGNERPSADELIGRADTTSGGIAVLDFLVDPAIFPAGEAEEGLHVQFGGDARYAVAGASGRVSIEAGEVDPDRCVIAIDPPDAALIADGNTTLTLVGTLVDGANNILGIDAPAHTVSFTADQGTVLLEEAERDVLTGTYSQQYRVPETEGDATVTIVVDGTAGSTRTLTFEGTGGCMCAGSSGPGWPAGLALVGGLLVFVGRRRRPAGAE